MKSILSRILPIIAVLVAQIAPSPSMTLDQYYVYWSGSASIQVLTSTSAKVHADYMFWTNAPTPESVWPTNVTVKTELAGFQIDQRSWSGLSRDSMNPTLFEYSFGVDTSAYDLGLEPGWYWVRFYAIPSGQDVNGDLLWEQFAQVYVN